MMNLVSYSDSSNDDETEVSNKNMKPSHLANESFR